MNRFKLERIAEKLGLPSPECENEEDMLYEWVMKNE